MIPNISIPVGAARGRYLHSEYTDKLIRSAYHSAAFGKQRGAAIESLIRQLGWPRHVIYKRALKIGASIPKTKPSRWTEAEAEILESSAHRNLDEIQRKLRAKGFERTREAIAIFIRRRMEGVRQSRIDAGIMTAQDLAACFGVNAKSVGYWIECGWLEAKKILTGRPEGRYEIHERQVRSFIQSHPARINLAACDKYWLIDLLTRPLGELR